MLSCHAIISKLITETTSFLHSDSAGIIRLDHSDWLFLVSGKLFWDFLFYGAHVRWTLPCPKAQRHKDLNVSQLDGTYFHLADWQMIGFPCGCSCFQKKIFILLELGRTMWPFHYCTAANWNVSLCPGPDSWILLRRSLTVISTDPNIVGKAKVASNGGTKLNN